MQGFVVKSTGSWYIVNHHNTPINCRIKGKFRLKGIKNTNPVTVGDMVDFYLEENEETGVITNIHERKNYLIRKSVNLSKQTHIIASNIDHLFLLVTINNPPTFTSFIDRVLCSAQAYHINSIIIFNKIDSYTKEENIKKDALIKTYKSIGYTCIEVSALKNHNVAKLKELMKDKTSLFVGHSGAGKSTLANVIDSSLNLKTNTVSTSHNQGQHTTTFAEMHALPFGGYLIDTPGIKGFGVVDFEADEVGDYFPEILRLSEKCKFNNCMHVNEPKCAVKDALENNEIAQSRYNSYLQLVLDEKDTYRTNNY